MQFRFWTPAVVCALLLLCSAAWSATTKYKNLEDSTLVDNGVVGWGSCIVCAGGGSINASIASSPFQTTPSMDGSSRDFLISGDPYSDALWWYKVGPNDAATTFTFDFWLNVASNTQAAQALEFDLFQFISGREFMFGTQCDYASGTWDVWNAGSLAWAHTKIACKKFAPNTWYHLTLAFHRTSDNKQHYDTLAIVQYKPNGRVASNNSYNFKATYPSQFTPAGWNDDLGVQFQMDIGGTGATMQEWVDEITLTAK